MWYVLSVCLTKDFNGMCRRNISSTERISLSIDEKNKKKKKCKITFSNVILFVNHR